MPNRFLGSNDVTQWIKNSMRPYRGIKMCLLLLTILVILVVRDYFWDGKSISICQNIFGKIAA